MICLSTCYSVNLSESDETLNSRFEASEYTCIIEWGTMASVFGSTDSSIFKGPGKFNTPDGITVDSDGYVYVADRNNHRIQKFDSEGNFIKSWGDKGNSDRQFNLPCDLEVDKEGNIYIVDYGNHRIKKFDSEGNFITKWGHEGNEDGQFNYPTGIAIDPSGDIYVIDKYYIQKFTSKGKFIAKWKGVDPDTSDGIEKTIYGIAIDPSGNVFVGLNFFGDTPMAVITRLGNDSLEFAFVARFDYINDITIDSIGNFYIANTCRQMGGINKYDKMGNLVTAWFCAPCIKRIAVDFEGNVYVSNCYIHSIQKFAPKPEYKANN